MVTAASAQGSAATGKPESRDAIVADIPSISRRNHGRNASERGGTTHSTSQFVTICGENDATGRFCSSSTVTRNPGNRRSETTRSISSRASPMPSLDISRHTTERLRAALCPSQSGSPTMRTPGSPTPGASFTGRLAGSEDNAYGTKRRAAVKRRTTAHDRNRNVLEGSLEHLPES